MHVKKILFISTIALLLLASYLTFLTPSRFGSHGDHDPCGKNLEKVYHSTATSFFLFTGSKQAPNSHIGSCPYQVYEARTYAVEVWLAAILSGASLYLLQRNRLSHNQETSLK